MAAGLASTEAAGFADAGAAAGRTLFAAVAADGVEARMGVAAVMPVRFFVDGEAATAGVAAVAATALAAGVATCFGAAAATVRAVLAPLAGVDADARTGGTAAATCLPAAFGCSGTATTGVFLAAGGDVFFAAAAAVFAGVRAGFAAAGFVWSVAAAVDCALAGVFASARATGEPFFPGAATCVADDFAFVDTAACLAVFEGVAAGGFNTPAGAAGVLTVLRAGCLTGGDVACLPDVGSFVCGLAAVRSFVGALVPAGAAFFTVSVAFFAEPLFTVCTFAT